jgi:Domain of unknown function (DUF5666)/Domain of unknown function (DUF5667)
MNKKLLDALESCLQRMEHGEPLDAVLTRYPILAAQLRPLLETAARARSATEESLPVTVLARHRSRGLNLAADLRQAQGRSPLRRHSWRPALTVLAVIALLAMSSNGLLIASAHSIPGDTLYPLKRSVETTQLRLVTNPAEREALEHKFDERRVDETRSLLTDQRVEGVEFTGVVSSQSVNEWLVSEIHVVVTAHTEIDGDIVVGDMVEVRGATNHTGGVDASRLALVKNPATDDSMEVSPPHITTLIPSGESNVQETPEESSVTPARSGEENHQSGDGKDQSSEKSHESHSSSDSNRSCQSESGCGQDS